MEKKRKRKNRMTSEQKKFFIFFLEQNEQMVTKKFSEEFTFGDSEKLWQECADRLNERGPSKTVQEWKRSWMDIKGKAMKMARQLTNLNENEEDYAHESSEPTYPTAERVVPKTRCNGRTFTEKNDEDFSVFVEENDETELTPPFEEKFTDSLETVIVEEVSKNSKATKVSNVKIRRITPIRRVPAIRHVKIPSTETPPPSSVSIAADPPKKKYTKVDNVQFETGESEKMEALNRHIVALERQTAAIEKQTSAIQAQTTAMVQLSNTFLKSMNTLINSQKL